MPFGHHLSNTVSQHAAKTQPKIQRMRDHQGKYIARKVDNDGSVTFERESVIAIKPGARGGRVATRLAADLMRNGLDDVCAFGNCRSTACIVTAHDDSGPKAMSGQRLRIGGKRGVDIAREISAVREESFEDWLKPLRSIGDRSCVQKFCGLRSYRHDDLAKFAGCDTLP